MKKRIVTVDRERWLRGLVKNYNGCEINSALLVTTCLNNEDDEKSLMCCLGFDCIGLGFTEDQIAERAMPDSVASLLTEARDGDGIQKLISAGLLVQNKYEDGYDATYDDSKVAEVLAEINDDRSINDAAREYAIQKVYATINVTVEFIN